MAPSIPTKELANGVEMPLLSIGTAPLDINGKDGFTGFYPEKNYRIVQLALECGMRHIDTALLYRSHKAISHVLGNWFASGDLERDDLFITSKICHGPTQLAMEGTVHNYDAMTPEQITVQMKHDFERSLQELGMGYVDLMLLHWPGNYKSKSPGNRARRIAAWKVLESFYLEKKWARAIGVSNFSEHHLEQLQADGATIMPMVNQIETSVYIQHENIIKYCQANNICVVAYSPLGRGVNNICDDPAVLKIAKKHDKTPGQIALRFLVQQDIGICFLSTNKDRIQSNVEIFSFQLDRSDMDELSKLKKPDGTWGVPSPYDIS